MTMHRPFLRLLALFLAFSLVQDTAVTASIGQSAQTSSRCGSRFLRSALFLEQAIVQPSAASPHPGDPTSKGTAFVDRQSEQRMRTGDHNGQDQPRADVESALIMFPPANGEICKLKALDNGRTAVIDIAQGKVFIINLLQMKKLFEIRASEYSSDMTISQNGSRIAQAIGFTINLSEVNDRKTSPGRSIPMPGRTRIGTVEISNDGRTVIASASDDPDEEMRMPSIAVIQGHSVTAVIYGKKKEAIRLSGNGRRLFTIADNGKVSEWDIPPAEGSHGHRPLVIQKLTNSFYPGSGKAPGPNLLDMAISETGDVLMTLSEDSVIRFYNTKDPPRVSHWELDIPNDEPAGNSPVTVALSPDGHLAAVGYHDGMVKIWDVRHRAPIGILGYDKPEQSKRILSVMISDDGFVMATSVTGHWAWIAPVLTQEQYVLREAVHDLSRTGRLPILSASPYNRRPMPLLEGPAARREPDRSILAAIEGKTQGERVRLFRKWAGWIVEAVATALGLATRTINALELETEHEFENLRNWQNLANLYGVDVFYLLAGKLRASALAERTIGERIRLLRRARGYSKEELRRRLGVPLTTLESWELDQWVPNAEYQLRLIRELSATPEELFENRVRSADYPQALRWIATIPELLGAARSRALSLGDYMRLTGTTKSKADRDFRQLTEAGYLSRVQIAIRGRRAHYSLTQKKGEDTVRGILAGSA